MGMDGNLRVMGQALRQLQLWAEWAAEQERVRMAKQRGIMRRIVDSNVRLMGMGYNKLVEEWKARQSNLKEKLRFVIKALTDKDAMFTLQAYNGMKQRWNMLNGVGMGDAGMKKVQLIKRLTNSAFNLEVQAVNALRDFLKSERVREEAERLEYERQQKEKDRLLRRMMDVNARMQGQALRQLGLHCETEAEKERARMAKQRGIMRRIVDSNTRLMGMGYNKLVEEWKARQANLREKLRFVIKALTDKDAQFTLQAYNGLKQRALMLNGVGMGDAAMKKVQLIKRLTNQGYNLQVMAANAIKEWLTSERHAEEMARLERERQQKEKDRILRRIMDSNLRFAGLAFRQAFQWMEAEREKEIALMRRQRGICNRIVDANTRLMGAGFNKLIEEWKAARAEAKEKMKFIIKSLTDKDARFILCAYNGLVQRANMLNGIGLDKSQMKKIQLIKRLTNQ